MRIVHDFSALLALPEISVLHERLAQRRIQYVHRLMRKAGYPPLPNKSHTDSLRLDCFGGYRFAPSFPAFNLNRLPWLVLGASTISCTGVL
jgi:hypothetical protein